MQDETWLIVVPKNSTGVKKMITWRRQTQSLFVFFLQVEGPGVKKRDDIDYNRLKYGYDLNGIDQLG